MTDLTREMQCRRTVNDGKDQCPWRGPLAEFPAHTEETGHASCVVCHQPLADYEEHACNHCLNQATLDLNEIEDAYATLPDVVVHSGYRMSALPGGDALVMLVDGSTEGGGPDDWLTDPTPVIAVLEANERQWRQILKHGPADDVATVSGCTRYLRTWLRTAARQHPTFGDYVGEIRKLRSRLQHVAGLADDPRAAPAECFDCGGQLQRSYRPLRSSLPERIAAARAAVAADEQRIAKHTHAETIKHPDQPELRSRPRVPSREARVRHAVTGGTAEGLTDTLTCARCHRVYNAAEYGLALRMRANSISGWVTVRVAAETLRRNEQTVWRWVYELDVPVACSVRTRRVLVEWEQTKQLSDVVARRLRRDEQEEVAS